MTQYYTKEELKVLDETKRALACRLVYRSPRPAPWTQDEFLDLVKHNVCTMPIEAARMASQGHHKVAAAILRLVVFNLEAIQGIEAGTMEYRDRDVYVIETGEKL